MFYFSQVPLHYYSRRVSLGSLEAGGLGRVEGGHRTAEDDVMSLY